MVKENYVTKKGAREFKFSWKFGQKEVSLCRWYLSDKMNLFALLPKS